jgi:hypothetical protein
MLFKRGSTISAAEGGCQAEVGGTSYAESVQCSHRENILGSGMLDGQRWVCRMHGRYIAFSQQALLPLNIISPSIPRNCSASRRDWNRSALQFLACVTWRPTTSRT